MSNPFIGEIRMFGGNFAPQGWAFCNGQLLPISENDALFNLIGTTYGGDGQTTFALPDLQGRIPIHQASGFTLGQNGGVETVTLTASEIPAHTHEMQCANRGGNQRDPAGALPAIDGAGVTAIFSNQAPNAQSRWPETVVAGGSQPHSNMQPFLCISFIISLFGIFPTQT